LTTSVVSRVEAVSKNVCLRLMKDVCGFSFALDVYHLLHLKT
jgi:hypothetical protein